jgi:diguanylate cyclase (GGDEF)-like protein
MRWAWQGLLGACIPIVVRCLAAMALVFTAAAHAAPVVHLSDETPRIDQTLAGLQWIDPRGDALLTDVLAGKGAFTPLDIEQVHRLGHSGALWVHLRLVRAERSRDEWVLEVPLPLIDFVAVYHQDHTGAWRSESAGDTLAVAGWREAGRFPVFRLELPRGTPRDVYLQVKHNATGNFPLRLATQADHAHRMQIGYLSLGIVFGGLLLLIATCLAQSRMYRDVTYAWYAGYAALVTIAVAAYTGAAAHLIWPRADGMADFAQGCLALLAGAGALLFVRDLSGISARHTRLAAIVQWTGWVGPVLAVVYAFIDRPIGVVMVGAYLMLSSALNLLVAWRAWQRGDLVGLWVFGAFTPLTLALVLVAARLFGLTVVSWFTQYSVVAALALQVPLLLVALNMRSRERHGAEIREQALSSQDALTGLLAPHLFHDRMRQVVARHKRDREPAAIVFIDLVNYPRIKQYYGTAVAEQSLLRSVIKLRRLVRDADTVSRIGEARFALMLEGVNSRFPVMDRAARLIAAGLMPLKGLKPDVTLQFHIACALLGERSADATELVDALSELLAGMSPRTRRPIRFLDPDVTAAVEPSSDSSLLNSDSVLLAKEEAATVAAVETKFSRNASSR